MVVTSGEWGTEPVAFGYRPSIMSPSGRLLLLSLVIVLPFLAACGTETRAQVTASRVQSVDPGTPRVVRPAAVPLVAGEVRTTWPVMVLDAGEGPVLCGPVDDSYPPQCDGHSVLGWDWESVEHESASGTRWASAGLTGTFDGDRFTVTGIDHTATGDARPEPVHVAACPEPEAGWQAVDPTRVTETALSWTVEWARGMEGVGGVWVTRPSSGVVADTVLNVTTTGDVAALEAELRHAWAGRFCVAEAGEGRTDADLHGIVDELGGLPGLQAAWVSSEGVVEVTVLIDDGSIQRWVDSEYGDGAVRVSAVLVPVASS